MTVAELIEELNRLPQHIPVMCEGDRVDESIMGVGIRHLNMNVGTVAVIFRIPEQANDTEDNDF